MTMASCIVRIHRREVGDAIAGVREEALSRRTRAFHSLAEPAESGFASRRPPTGFWLESRLGMWLLLGLVRFVGLGCAFSMQFQQGEIR